MSNIYNLSVDQGSTFQKRISIKNANSEIQSLIGYDARMKIKTSFTALSTLCDMTVANSRVVVNATTNEITLLIPASVTAAFPPAKYVYDLEVIDPAGIVTKCLKGIFEVFAEVTT